MADTIYYVNSKGDTVNLCSSTIRCNIKDTKVFSYNNKDGYLTDKAKSFSFQIVCLGKENADNLIDLLEWDAISNKYGQLYVNDWYLRVKFTGVTGIKKEGSDAVNFKVSWYAESSLWAKKHTVYLDFTSEYSPKDPLNEGDNFLDMNYDAYYDYAPDSISLSTIYNTQNYPAEIIIRADGNDADGLNVQVTGEDFNNYYICEKEMTEGKELVIDGERKRVEYDGDDVFGSVPDSSNVFAKIPHGEFFVSWNGSYGLTVQIVERRGMPVWNY